MGAGRYSLEAIFKAVDRVTRPIDKMQQRMRRFTESTEKNLKSIDKVTGATIASFGKLALTMGAVGTIAAAGLAAAAKPGVDFEQQIADLGATSLMTRDQIQDLEKEAMRLGAATKFSATEVAAGMEVMAKAGYDNQQILDGVGGMIYAAAAAGEDLATTTETVTSVLKGMGLEASATSNVADILALASVRTNSSIASLGESMSKVASTSRQLKVPLLDTVSMVALLQDVGLDASEAGSATATMLTKLAKPSAAVAAQMRSMGVSFQDAAGNMLAPTAVLEQLVKAGKKAGGNMKQVAFFADLVGLRGQKAALNLKDLFASGKVDSLNRELTLASGTAEKMAALRMNTFTGDLDVLTENIKAFSIELFGLASGPLRQVLRGFTAWLDANKALIVSGIVGFVQSVADNLPTIALWAERIGKAAAVWFTWALAVKAATLATVAFNAILAMTPVGLIITALVAAVALIVAFWPEISAFFSKVWGGITELAGRVWAAATGLATSISAAVVGALSGAWNAVTGVISTAGSMLLAGLAAVWGPVSSFLVGAFEFVAGVVAILAAPFILQMRLMFRAFSWLVAQIKTIWMPVQAFLVRGFLWIADRVAEVCVAIAGFFGALWDGVKMAATVAFDWIAAAATVVVETLRAIWAPIGEFFGALWQGIATAIGAVWDGIATVVGGVIDGMISKLTYVFELVAKAVAAVRGVGRDALDGVGLGGGETPQVVSPHERAAAGDGAAPPFGSAEVTIKAPPGSASVTKRPQRGGWFDVALAPSGRF